jgi:hypothetical protein
MLGKPTVEFIKPWAPVWAQRIFLKAMIRIIVGRYEQYGLQRPDHKIFERHPTVNSELLYFLRHGRVTPHPDIQAFNGESVSFVDGASEQFDLVVCATGYHLSIPFLAPGVLEWRAGIPQLVGGMLAPGHKHIYFFGLGQARYGAGPLITAGAEALCAMIEAQRQLGQPLGTLLARLGMRPAKSMLVNPHDVLRGARQARRLLPKLVYAERLLGRGG